MEYKPPKGYYSFTFPAKPFDPLEEEEEIYFPALTYFLAKRWHAALDWANEQEPESFSEQQGYINAFIAGARWADVAGPAPSLGWPKGQF